MKYWIVALALFLSVVPAYAAENLPDYAHYGVCITGQDPRAQTDPDHFGGSALGFAPDKSVVTNSIQHWHLQDIARDLNVPVADLIATLAEKYHNEGQCTIMDFYRSDDGGGAHHNAFFPYDQGQGKRYIEYTTIQGAIDATQASGPEYLNPSMDQEEQAKKGLRGVGQTNTEQGKKRGED